MLSKNTFYDISDCSVDLEMALVSLQITVENKHTETDDKALCKVETKVATAN